MIRVRVSPDVVTNILQQGAKYNNIEVTQGIPPNSTIVDLDWDNQTGIVSIIFDIGDGDDTINEYAIVISTGAIVQTPMF